jgi:hypothetical protein
MGMLCRDGLATNNNFRTEEQTARRSDGGFFFDTGIF